MEKNRDGNAHNHATISLLMSLASDAAPSKMTIREKTLNFIRQVAKEVRLRGRHLTLVEDLDRYYEETQQSPKVDELTRMLVESSGMSESQIRKVLGRYIANEQSSFKAERFKQDIQSYLKDDSLEGDETMKESIKRIEEMGPQHKRTLELIADYLNSNQIAVYGAFNKVDSKKLEYVKSVNDFASALKTMVPSTVKPADLKELAKRYQNQKKEIHYKQFFKDIDAFLHILQNKHYSSV